MEEQAGNNARLLCDVERQRWFIVPNDVVLPAGDFLLHQVGGEDMLVKPDAIDAFQVDRDAAKAWLKERLAGTFREGKQALMDAFRRGLGEKLDSAAKAASPAKRPRGSDAEELVEAAKALQNFAKVLEAASGRATARLADAADALGRVAAEQAARPDDAAADLEAEEAEPESRRH